jgi:hypothetical protein
MLCEEIVDEFAGHKARKSNFQSFSCLKKLVKLKVKKKYRNIEFELVKKRLFSKFVRGVSQSSYATSTSDGHRAASGRGDILREVGGEGGTTVERRWEK